MTTTSGPLDYERHALRRILERLMDEEGSLDSLCKHAPRLVSVAANAARIEATLTAGRESDEVSTLRKVLLELTTETTDEEGESAW